MTDPDPTKFKPIPKPQEQEKLSSPAERNKKIWKILSGLYESLSDEELNALLEEVLDDPAKNTADYLEKMALELYALPEKELEKRGKSAKESKEKEEEKTLQAIRKRHWVS